MTTVGSISITRVVRPVSFSRPAGPRGVGVPAGGTTGQSLTKASGDDYDTEWTTVSGGGGGTVDELNDVGDVTITSAVSGEFLKWNGTAWVNAEIAQADVTGLVAALAGKADATHSHAAGDITSGTLADALVAESNVTQHQAALAITESQITDLGSYLEDITGSSITDLANVTITTPANGELLVYSAGSWINQTIAEAGVAAVGHTHAASDVTSGTFATARISEASVTQHEAAMSIGWGQLTSVPSEFTPEDHTHTLSDITDAGGAASLEVGTTAGTVAAGDDSRLSDARTPTAHAASHADGGTDELDVADLASGAATSGQVPTANGTGGVTWADQTGGAPASAQFVTLATDATLTNERVMTAGTGIDIVDGGAGSTVTIGVLADEVNHDGLLNFVASEHVDHTGVSITAGVGITGGGTIAASRTLDLDISTLTADTTVGGTDAIAIHDGAMKRVTLAQFEAALTVTESQISDLGTYLTDITGENLGDLANVTQIDVASGEILGWNGFTWVNRTLAEAGIAAASHTHAAADITTGTFADGRISESSVTQHEAALSIAESQVPLREDFVAGFDGGGAAIANGEAIRRPVARACTVTLARLVADQTGSITITANKYTPSDSTTMGSETPLGTIALSSENNKTSGALSWSVGAGDILEFVTSGVATVERVVVTLKAES